MFLKELKFIFIVKRQTPSKVCRKILINGNLGAK